MEDAVPGRPNVIGIARGSGGGRTVVPYWADSALLATAGIPTVLFGPRGGGEHERVEWVELASVERLRDVLVATANDYCGPAEPASERFANGG